VLNQAEALVAIDVNSGRATREHHIEDTALKTNLEAADEIARQLRLRDLAGLIVIDFIDMEETRNNRAVERRLKECLKQDRARIQVGRISHFGLMEMSRQRIRASVLESSTEKCPYCGGSGHMRSVSSLALQVLRALEEQLMRGATHNLIARTRPDVALYVLNQKRAHLRGLEERFAITITISADESVAAPQAFVIDRGEQVHTIEAARALAERAAPLAAPLEEEDDLEDTGVVEGEAVEDAAPGAEEQDAAPGEQQEEGPKRRRRRRRRGRENGGNGVEQPMPGEPHAAETDAAAEGESFVDAEEDAPADEAGLSSRGEEPREHDEKTEPNGERRRRRRGRRGGRRNRQERERNGEFEHNAASPQPEFIADGLDRPAQTESELTHAVADLDAPRPAEARTESWPESRPEAPAPVEPAPLPAASEPEPPRRRSTIREPAPVAASVSETSPASPPPSPPPAQPAPEPVITEVEESQSADRPRRTGWWSRRFAGG